MKNNILSSVAEDYKKDLVKVGVAFVGGIAVGFILSKAMNGNTIERIKTGANDFVSDLNNQTNEFMESAQKIEILDPEEKEEILDLKKEKEPIKVDIKIDDNDE